MLQATLCLGSVAQDIGKKERTSDVVTGQSRERTFADMMLSEPVLAGLRYRYCFGYVICPNGPLFCYFRKLENC